MWWRLILAYLLALPAILWLISRTGRVLGGSQSSLGPPYILERRRR
jgi:hypothetical protein